MQQVKYFILIFVMNFNSSKAMDNPFADLEDDYVAVNLNRDLGYLICQAIERNDFCISSDKITNDYNTYEDIFSLDFCNFFNFYRNDFSNKSQIYDNNEEYHKSLINTLKEEIKIAIPDDTVKITYVVSDIYCRRRNTTK